jgi:glycosyltransferase involved in cell wall biosynthesis
MPAPPRVSVVIPTLNEEARIERQLRRLGAQAGWHEVIVVDGGSSDRTIERARTVSGVKVFTSSVGRG